jgi:3-polyprenyl-4-hydroxybenzoate decarboxylase
VVEGPRFNEDPEAAAGLAGKFPGWPLVVLVDDAKTATRTDPRFLWTTFTRFEPAADVHGMRRIHRNHLVFEGTVLIDARFKPTYPAELFCDPETAATVSRRWSEYFPAKAVEMGDSDVADLG